MRLEDRVPFDRAGFGTVMRNFVGNLGAPGCPHGPQVASRPRVRVISERSFGGGHTRVGDAAELQDPDHHFASSQLSAAMRSRNGFNALSLSSISRMRASAAASRCGRP